MTQEEAKKLRKGSRVFYAGSIYEFATIKKFPHGVMIGIYDEPPLKHVDYLQPSNANVVYPCCACIGNGCPVCNGSGEIIGN